MTLILNLIWTSLLHYNRTLVFSEKYDYVGRLLRPGEEPTNYSEEEEEGSQQEPAEKPKDEWNMQVTGPITKQGGEMGRLCSTMLIWQQPICFVRPKALQAWELACLLEWYKANLLCGVVMSLFSLSRGTIYFMWQLPLFATNFTRQGEWWLMIVF